MKIHSPIIINIFSIIQMRYLLKQLTCYIVHSSVCNHICAYIIHTTIILIQKISNKNFNLTENNRKYTILQNPNCTSHCSKVLNSDILIAFFSCFLTTLFPNAFTLSVKTILTFSSMLSLIIKRCTTVTLF